MFPPSVSALAARLFVWLTAVLFAGGTFAWSAWRWWTYQYGTFDLAFYVQGLWLTLHGASQTSLLGVSLLGNHAEPIVYFALPLFALWPHPLLLPLLQILALATLPFTAGRIARHLGLGESTGTLLALALVLAPAAGFVALHEFHPEALAAPLLLLVAEARLRQRPGWFWLWWLLAVATKENIALLLGWWALVEALSGWRQGWDWRRQWRWNFLPALVAFAWAGLYIGWLAPVLNGGRVDYHSLYAHLTAGTGSLLETALLHPDRILQVLGHAVLHGDLLWGLLLPLLALPLLRPRWLLIAMPILLQHLLSERPSEWTIRWHYAAPLVPLFWLAAAEALRRFPARGHAPLGAAVLAAAAVAQVWIGPLRDLPAEWIQAPARFAERPWRAAQIAAIQADATAPVLASHGYLAHLATRPQLYSLHHLLKGLVTLGGQRLPPLPRTDYIVVDYADASTFSALAGFYHPTMRTIAGEIVPSSDRLFHDYLRTAVWECQAINSVTRFHRLAGTPSAALPVDPPASAVRPEAVAVVAPRAVEVEANGTSLRLELDWKFALPRRDFRWLELIVTGPDQILRIVRGLAGPEVGEAAAGDSWTVHLPPDLAPGSYRLRLLVHDRLRALWDPQAGGNILPYTHQIINLGEVKLGAPVERK